MKGSAQINARKLQKRIEVMTLSAVNDGFGGKEVQEGASSFYWADWRSMSSLGKNITNLQELGINDFSQIFKVTVRKNDIFDDTEKIRIKYKSVIYDILSTQEADLRGIRINLIVKEHRVGS